MCIMFRFDDGGSGTVGIDLSVLKTSLSSAGYPLDSNKDTLVILPSLVMEKFTRTIPLSPLRAASAGYFHTPYNAREKA